MKPFQRKGRNRPKTMVDSEIFITDFDYGYLINTNCHIDIIRQLSEIACKTYKIVAKFEYLGYNGNCIEVNARTLCYRPSKFTPIIYNEGVKLIEGKECKQGGSNAHPGVTYANNICILEFVSDGLPTIDEINGWKMTIMEMNIVA